MPTQKACGLTPRSPLLLKPPKYDCWLSFLLLPVLLPTFLCLFLLNLAFLFVWPLYPMLKTFLKCLVVLGCPLIFKGGKLTRELEIYI